MKTTEGKAIIKERLSIYDILNYYAPRKINKDGMCCCPIHTENRPSCKINKNDTFFCFSCGKHGDSIALVGAIFNLDFKSAINKIITDFGLQNILDKDNDKLSQKVADEINKKNLEKKQKQSIQELNTLITKTLLQDRRVCVKLHDKSLLNEREITLYAQTKERIKKLETIYVALNKLSFNTQDIAKPTDIIKANKNFFDELKNPT